MADLDSICRVADELFERITRKEGVSSPSILQVLIESYADDLDAIDPDALRSWALSNRILKASLCWQDYQTTLQEMGPIGIVVAWIVDHRRRMYREWPLDRRIIDYVYNELGHSTVHNW